MSVETTTNRIAYVGNGTQDTFPYPFKIFAPEDLEVYLAGAKQTLTTHYTVTGAGNGGGGDVVFVTAPANGASVVIIRVLAATQLVVYPPNSKFPASVHEAALDRLTMMVQQLQETDKRALKLAITSLLTDLSLPDPVSGRALRWKADLSGFENYDPNGVPVGSLNLPVSIANGGTGAADAATARANLAVAAATHTHEGADIASGLLAAERLGSGSAGATTMLRGDQTWQPIPTLPAHFAQALHVRTHPDNDVAARKIMLVHADALVMNDGSIVTGWDQLVADITVSGANGLDTGAERPSAWYDVFAIRKSSDGTKGLLLHETPVPSQNQAFTTENSQTALRAGATTNVKLAQSMQVSVAAPLLWVDLKLYRNGTPNGNIWVTLQGDNGTGRPNDSNILATSDKLNAANVALTTGEFLRFVFRNPPTLETGVTYHIVLQGDYTPGGTNVQWRDNTTGGYSDGQESTYNGTVWTTVAARDFVFRAFLQIGTATPVMPPGYDQYALVDEVYNDAAGNFRAHKKEGGDVAYFAQATALNISAYQTLERDLDLSTFVPPRAAAFYGIARLKGNTAAAVTTHEIGLRLRATPQVDLVVLTAVGSGFLSDTSGTIAAAPIANTTAVIMPNNFQQIFYTYATVTASPTAVLAALDITGYRSSY